MKELLVFAFVCLTLASCVKIEDLEPEDKEFQCNCTYVAISGGPNDGEPNKDESTKVISADNFEADIECAGLEDKYAGQFFDGTCLIQ